MTPSPTPDKEREAEKIIVKTTFFGDLEFPNLASVVVTLVLLIVASVGLLYAMSRLP